MLVTHTQMENQIEKSADFFLLVWFIFWWIRPIYSRTCWTQSLVCCLHLSWVNGPEITFLPNFLIFELVRCHRPVSCDLNGFHPVFVDVEVPLRGRTRTAFEKGPMKSSCLGCLISAVNPSVSADLYVLCVTCWNMFTFYPLFCYDAISILIYYEVYVSIFYKLLRKSVVCYLETTHVTVCKHSPAPCFCLN